MKRSERDMKAAGDLYQLRQYIALNQRQAIRDCLHGQESDWFAAKLDELVKTINTMPKTYEQEGAGDNAIVHLHYFTAGGDWYITERDCEKEQHQAFGLADPFQDGGELGYISIIELTEAGAELDLHWTPKPLKDCRKRQEDAAVENRLAEIRAFCD